MRHPEHVRGRDLQPRVGVWQSQRNSPEMRLIEPATMTTPNNAHRPAPLMGPTNVVSTTAV
jgi:hypothetical protein